MNSDTPISDHRRDRSSFLILSDGGTETVSDNETRVPYRVVIGASEASLTLSDGRLAGSADEVLFGRWPNDRCLDSQILL